MGVKNRVTRLIPSYRAKDAILDQLSTMSQTLQAMSKRLDDMDRKNEYLFYCLQHLDNETELDTKKRVFLNLPKADGKVRDFQIVANYILQRTKKVCDENNISFFLDFGTLLGAVRHHGFIPWDDDVDLGVSRNDYYRMMDVINKDPELEMHRYYRYTRPGVEAGYVTKVKLRSSNLFFVDVFPVDELDIPANDFPAVWQESVIQCEAYHQKLKEVFDKYDFSADCCVPTWHEEMDDEVAELERCFLDQSRRETAAEGSENKVVWFGVDQLAWIRKTRKGFPANVFFPLLRDGVLFEGQHYNTLHETEHYLHLVYGDYMSFPRIIQQVHSKELRVDSEKDREIVEVIKKHGHP